MSHAIEHGPDGTHGTNGSSGHENREASVKLIVYAAVALAIMVVIVMILMWGTFNLLKNEQQAEQHNSSPLAPAVQVPPEPRLEEKPWMSLLESRAREDHILTTYGWQDQKSGIVRIPIDQAMDIVAQNGPAGGKNAPPAGGKNAAK